MSTQELRLAILYDVISRLGDVRKIQLQKIVYFLQEQWSVPTKFPFKMHHYGPYSAELETDTTRLKFAGYVAVEPDPKGYGYHITSTDDPREDWGELLRSHSESIEHVIETLGRRPISELELAATIHFLKGLRPQSSTEALLKEVKALKPKFHTDYVSRVHAELESLCQ